MAQVNRASVMAFCGLLAAAPVYADPEHNATPAASRADHDAMLRHRMRDSINTGLVGTHAAEQDGQASAPCFFGNQERVDRRGVEYRLVEMPDHAWQQFDDTW